MMAVTLLAEPSVYEAAKAFVLVFAFPDVPDATVIQGWQNRTALPVSTHDYAVVSVLSHIRHGTDVEDMTFDADSNGVIRLRELMECSVQLDICARDDKARRRAQALETVARSSLGAAFFGERGLSVLYAEDVRDLSFVGGEKQFVRRYMTTLRLTYWTGISQNADYWNTASITNHYPVL